MSDKFFKMCGSKIEYNHKRNADKHLKHMRKIGLIIPRNAHSYHCPFCGKWHLGHSNREN